MLTPELLGNKERSRRGRHQRMRHRPARHQERRDEEQIVFPHSSAKSLSPTESKAETRYRKTPESPATNALPENATGAPRSPTSDNAPRTMRSAAPLARQASANDAGHRDEKSDFPTGGAESGSDPAQSRVFARRESPQLLSEASSSNSRLRGPGVPCLACLTDLKGHQMADRPASMSWIFLLNFHSGSRPASNRRGILPASTPSGNRSPVSPPTTKAPENQGEKRDAAEARGYRRARWLDREQARKEDSRNQG